MTGDISRTHTHTHTKQYTYTHTQSHEQLQTQERIVWKVWHFRPCRPIKIVNFNPTNRITVQQNEYLIWFCCIFVQAVCLLRSVSQSQSETEAEVLANYTLDSAVLFASHRSFAASVGITSKTVKFQHAHKCTHMHTNKQIKCEWTDNRE